METWFVILLSIIAAGIVLSALFVAKDDDDRIRLPQLRFRREKSENDKAAIICQTIIDTGNPVKAYSLFIEFVFANNRKYMRFVAHTLLKICDAYKSSDVRLLKKVVNDIIEMKKELKDQKNTQDVCVKPIDPAIVIESSVWVNMAMDLCFTINDCLARIAKVCIDYNSLYSMPIPEEQTEQLSFTVQDICNICKSADDLLAAGDVQGMKELRLRTAIIKSESYNVAQRLYQLLHDRRTSIDPARHISLSYALNAFQECHCIIYALRRIILCNLCLTLYATDAINDNVTSDMLAKYIR